MGRFAAGPQNVTKHSTRDPKAEKRLRELARGYGPEAIYTLVALMRDAKSTKIRHDAAVSLLDRGFGRTFQAEVPEPDEVDEAREETIEAAERLLMDGE